jgi:hypothetical protein
MLRFTEDINSSVILTNSSVVWGAALHINTPMLNVIGQLLYRISSKRPLRILDPLSP